MGNKILLIDDSVTVQKIISLTFSDEGVEVVAVDSGDEAINRLSYLRPALVMADVSIPGRNGYDICAYIKNSPELRQIPVILLVPGFETYDAERGRRVGADHHLTKPFQSIRSLIATVKSLINGGQPVTTGSLVAPEAPVPSVVPPVVPSVAPAVVSEDEESTADQEARAPGAPVLPGAFDRPAAPLPVMPAGISQAIPPVGEAGAAHPAPHWSPEIIDLLVGRISEQVTQQVTQQVGEQLAGHLEAEIYRALAAMNAELPARIAAQLTRDVPPPRYDDPDQLLELDDF